MQELYFCRLQLRFSKYDFNIKVEDNKQTIFDIVRKKYVALTPEEWVRQHVIHYLVQEHEFPKALISVEKKLIVNELVKRTDVVLYNRNAIPVLIVECKAPDIRVTQKTIDQVARYNLTLRVPYLWVTNGSEHVACRIDHVSRSYAFIEELPSGTDLLL